MYVENWVNSSLCFVYKGPAVIRQDNSIKNVIVANQSRYKPLHSIQTWLYNIKQVAINYKTLTIEVTKYVIWIRAKLRLYWSSIVNGLILKTSCYMLF
jgi:hypothetical protein